MSAAPTITGARPIPSLRTKTVPLRRSSNAKLRCGELADGVGPIRSLIRRLGPVRPGPIHRASLAVAVSTAARRRGRLILPRRRRKPFERRAPANLGRDAGTPPHLKFLTTLPCGRSGMMKRRTFLGGTLTAMSAGSLGAQSATAQAVIPAPAEPLVWPVVTKLPPGIRSFAGRSDTVPDIVGRIGTPPSLVIFTEGNHLMALLSDDILGAFPSWAKIAAAIRRSRSGQYRGGDRPPAGRRTDDPHRRNRARQPRAGCKPQVRLLPRYRDGRA